MPLVGKPPTTKPLEAFTSPFDEMLARIARGELVARPELVILASKVKIEKPLSLVEWSERLAADLVGFSENSEVVLQRWRS